MDVKELNLEELQHEHQLILIDLQVMHRDYEEDDDDYDDNELIEMQNFECMCNRCDREIDWYHRYYYKCSMSSCNYSIHRFCKELPKTLQFQGHPSHTLILTKTTDDETCHSCFEYHQDGICYHCSICNYEIDLLCATFVEQSTIHHPSHKHPLISFSAEPGLIKCIACGEKHEGYFYQCVTCFNFLINYDCLSLPVKLLLQTKHFSHGHLLTLSYSFLDRLYDFECRICGMEFEDDHFIYKCSKCMYHVHPKCATQRIEPSILSQGLGQTEKNFKDADHPILLKFPLDDGSHILSYHIEWDTFERIDHMHRPLRTKTSSVVSLHEASSVVSLHDPMKRIKLQCTACSRPITKMPFFECSRSDECDFVLHDWCRRLPKELWGHVAHPQHPLKLSMNSSSELFVCDICSLLSNGFSYECKRCGFTIDVNCVFIPEEITHEAHANHLLTRVVASSNRLGEIKCHACHAHIKKREIHFRCSACDFHLDFLCAVTLPKTIRHKLDKHPLKLSYSPIEDHKSRYFCEVCEEELDPRKWFYHCVECAQSIHSVCAPLILQSEQGVNCPDMEGVYKLINIKFGVVQKKDHVHHHPVSFARGTSNDGFCHKCGDRLQSSLIWKCLHCKFARHCFACEIVAYDIDRSYPHHRPYVKVSLLGSSSVSKPMKRDQRQRNLKFYPRKMMRPMTHHWEIAKDVLE